MVERKGAKTAGPTADHLAATKADSKAARRVAQRAVKTAQKRAEPSVETKVERWAEKSEMRMAATLVVLSVVSKAELWAAWMADSRAAQWVSNLAGTSVAY